MIGLFGITACGCLPVTTNGVSVQLRTRSVRPSVRRIYARESISVPADMSDNVPVRLAFVNLHEQRADWLTESKEVNPGLLAARTLLNDDDTHAAIRFINVSGVDQVVRQSHSLGVATPAADFIIRKVHPSPDPLPADLDPPSADDQAEGNRHNGDTGDDHSYCDVTTKTVEPNLGVRIILTLVN